MKVNIDKWLAQDDAQTLRDAPAGTRPGADRLQVAWLVAAALGLACGLAWRFGPGPPGLLGLLSAASAAIWLLAAVPASNHEGFLLRQRFYIHRRSFSPALTQKLILPLAGNLALLTVAPAGFLLAFDGRALVITATQNEAVVMTVRNGPATMVCLLVIGLLVAVGSTVVWLLARTVLGSRYGLMVWLLAGMAVHAPFALGTSLLNIPLSVGQYASWALEHLAAWQANPIYNLDLYFMIGRHIGLLVLMLGLLLAALAMLQHRCRCVSDMVNPYWLAAFTGCLVTASRALVLSQTVSAGEKLTGLSGARDLFYSGLAASVAVLCLFILLRDRSIDWRGSWWVFWTTVPAVVWLLCGWPYLLADEAGNAVMVAHGVSVLLVYLLIAAMLRDLALAGRIPPLVRGFAVLVLLFLTTAPVLGGEPIVQAFTGWLGRGVAMGGPLINQVAAGMLLLAAVVRIILLAPRRRTMSSLKKAVRT